MSPGFLGTAHRPFEPTGEGMADLQPSDTVDAPRLVDRQSLLHDFDRMRRDLDTNGAMADSMPSKGGRLEF